MVASKETLEQIHDELATQLLKRIKSGEATAADFQAARQLLRDNNISAIAKPGVNPIGNLSLPFNPDEDKDFVN